jgi:uncharacterized coiled-coil protein SlyX
MIASMHGITVASEERIHITLEKLNDLITEFHEMTTIAKNVIVENDTALSNSVHHLETLLNQSMETLDSVNGVLAEVDRSIFENQHQYNQIMDNLNSMTKNINDFSQTIKERPWMLVRKTVPPERDLK